MGRKRNVYALRQALANDINEQNDYRLNDYKIIIKNVIGASKGVVAGLSSVSYTGLTLLINSGSVCDTERIYELLTTASLSIASTAGSYKIYAQYSSTDDLPVSGFKLLDVDTRTEEYNVVNVRTYDSITLGATTGTIPTNSEMLGIATVLGGEITAYTDQRVFITVANLTAYNLQSLSNQNKNAIVKTGFFSGIVGDQANNVFISSNLVGSNSAAISFNSLSDGNTSFKSTNANAGVGFFSLGSNIINTIGFKSNSNAINYQSTTIANTIGFQLNGVNSLDTGIEINNVENSILITNTSQNQSAKNINIKSGALFQTSLNAPEDYGLSVVGTYSGIRNTGIGFTSEWYQTTAANQQFIGFQALNNSAQNGGIGFQAQNGGDLSSNNLDYGFIATNSLIADFYSSSSIGRKGFVSERLESGFSDGVVDAHLLSASFVAKTMNYTTGFLISPLGVTSVENYGLVGKSLSGTSKFKNFIRAKNYDTGIFLDGSNVSGEVGLNVYNNRKGILIDSNDAVTNIGINILNSSEAIRIGSSNKIGIRIDSQNITDYNAIVLSSANRGIKSIDCGTDIFIIKTADSSGNAIVMDLANYQQGIAINNPKTVGVRIEMDGSPTLGQSCLYIVNGSNGTPAHITCVNPSATLPTVLVAGSANLQFTNNAGVFQMRFFDGAVWRTVNVT